jgi:hypothetical protein
LYDTSDIVLVKKISTIIYIGVLILTYHDFWILRQQMLSPLLQ